MLELKLLRGRTKAASFSRQNSTNRVGLQSQLRFVLTAAKLICLTSIRASTAAFPAPFAKILPHVRGTVRFHRKIRARQIKRLFVIFNHRKRDRGYITLVTRKSIHVDLLERQ